MEQIELKAEPRSFSGRHVKRVRAEGYVPAILYGSQIEATPIQIEGISLQKVLSKAGGNTLIALQIGKKKPVLTLAREIQRDIIRQNILHVDFLQVVMTEKITAEVPLVLTGEAPAVAKRGGILVHGLNTVEVQCLPADLPSSVEVDLSSLAEFNDMMTVADLQVPSAVVILSEPESVIARIEAPRLLEEEEEAVVEAEALVEPERVGRREEEEEAEGAE
ncbi:MAG: 50S ribosomal protein L25 [Anaerolineales bacterium]|nr:MAG: 50S ribosomal protein L25 [Anaerolineales bacterium]